MKDVHDISDFFPIPAGGGGRLNLLSFGPSSRINCQGNSKKKIILTGEKSSKPWFGPEFWNISTVWNFLPLYYYLTETEKRPDFPIKFFC